MDIFLDKIESLTPHTKQILCEQATEMPHTGTYDTGATQGSYLCRRCGFALFRADSQFSSGCGWPSFDVAIQDAIEMRPDADQKRIEIRCSRCHSHLGHVFDGEQFTAKNRRYCVNSLAIDFVDANEVNDSHEAIVAGGCFWGIDYYLSRTPGVIKVEVGYTGGTITNPTYTEVCQGKTGHYEAARIVYDNNKTNYPAILKRFFEIHDPTQANGQGPDIGSQYGSAVFYYDKQQLNEAQSLIQILQKQGYNAITHLLPVSLFWPAEFYHQDYYDKHNKSPYCHRPVARFDISI